MKCFFLVEMLGGLGTVSSWNSQVKIFCNMFDNVSLLYRLGFLCLPEYFFQKLAEITGWRGVLLVTSSVNDASDKQ